MNQIHLNGDGNTTSNSTKKRRILTKEEKQEILDGIKSGVNGFLDSLLNKSENNNSQIMNTDIFNVEISSSDNQNFEEAIKNNMAVGNFSNCEKILKNLYNISEGISLQIKKVEYDPSTDVDRSNDPNGSKGISFEFVNPLNKMKLNSTICNQVPTPLKIAFKKSERINIGLYQSTQAIRGIVDLYNKNSPGYSTRCLKTANDDSADTSINYRRTKMFQNTTMECSSGCEYKGLDDNKYVICDCKVSGKNEISNTGEDESLLKFPSLNYNIALCYKEAYSDGKLKENLGFIYSVVFIFLSCLSYILFRKIGKHLIKKKLIDLRRNDCLAYNEKKFSKNRYFLRKYFKKNSHNETYFKLNSFINESSSNQFSNLNNDYLMTALEKTINPFDFFPKKNREMKVYLNKSLIKKIDSHEQISLFDRKSSNMRAAQETKADIFNPKLFIKSKYLMKKEKHDIIGFEKTEKFQNIGRKIVNNKFKNKDFKGKIQKFKNEHNSKLIFKLKFITLRDYNELNPYQAIKYDKRSFHELLFHKLKEEHIFFNLFFHNSLLEPLWIRLILFYFNLSLLFALSALFFTDDYIDSRVDIPKEKRDSPLYSVMNETLKTLLSILFSFIILYILELTQAVNENQEEKISKTLKKGERNKILKQYEKFEKKMERKYNIFLLLSIFLNLLCLYYSTIFCYIYSNSVNGWIQGGVFGFIMDVFVISLAIPLIKVSVRVLIRKYKFLRFLIIIDYSFFILNFII